MIKRCSNCATFHFVAERTMHWSITSPQFSAWCQRGLAVRLDSREPPLTLRRILTAPRSVSKRFRGNIYAYNSSLEVGCVKTNWVSRGLASSSLESTITVHGSIYLFVSALAHPCILRPSVLSVYIHDTDYSVHGYARAAQIVNLNALLFE